MELHFSSANLQMRWGVVYLRLCTLLATYAYFSSSHLSWQKLSVVKFSILLVTMSSSRIGIAVASNYRSAANYYRERRPGLKLISDIGEIFLLLFHEIFCSSVSNDAWSCVKVWLNCVLIDYFTILTTSCTSFIFFLSHKLMMKQCIQSLKNTAKASMSKNPFKANNTLR